MHFTDQPCDTPDEFNGWQLNQQLQVREALLSNANVSREHLQTSSLATASDPSTVSTHPLQTSNGTFTSLPQTQSHGAMTASTEQAFQNWSHGQLPSMNTMEPLAPIQPDINVQMMNSSFTTSATPHAQFRDQTLTQLGASPFISAVPQFQSGQKDPCSLSAEVTRPNAGYMDIPHNLNALSLPADVYYSQRECPQTYSPSIPNTTVSNLQGPSMLTSPSQCVNFRNGIDSCASIESVHSVIGRGNSGGLSDVRLDTNDTKTKKVCCAKCDLVFSGHYAPSTLARHTKLKHSPAAASGLGNAAEVLLPCSKCERLFHRSDALLNHEREKHPELKRPPKVSRKSSNGSRNHSISPSIDPDKSAARTDTMKDLYPRNSGPDNN